MFFVQITKEDFTKFDYIFGKDSSNMKDLASLKPVNSTAKIELFGKYHTDDGLIIRDPYYVSSSTAIVIIVLCYQQVLLTSHGTLTMSIALYCLIPYTAIIVYILILVFNMLRNSYCHVNSLYLWTFVVLV